MQMFGIVARVFAYGLWWFVLGRVYIIQGDPSSNAYPTTPHPSTAAPGHFKNPSSRPEDSAIAQVRYHGNATSHELVNAEQEIKQSKKMKLVIVSIEDLKH